LAEVNGDATPYGLQHLLGRARWDADAVRDDLRAYLVTLFLDAGVFCSDVVRAASRVCKAVAKEGLPGGEQDKSRGGAIGTSTTLASNKSHGELRRQDFRLQVQQLVSLRSLLWVHVVLMHSRDVRAA